MRRDEGRVKNKPGAQVAARRSHSTSNGWLPKVELQNRLCALKMLIFNVQLCSAASAGFYETRGRMRTSGGDLTKQLTG